MAETRVSAYMPKGSEYSAFTAEQSVAMLGAEKLIANWCAVNLHLFWGVVQAGWTGDASKLTANLSGWKYLAVDGIWKGQEVYRIVSHYNITSGSISEPQAGTGAEVIRTVTGTYTSYYTVYGSAGSDQTLYLWGTDFVGEVTALSVKKVLFP